MKKRMLSTIKLGLPRQAICVGLCCFCFALFSGSRSAGTFSEPLPEAFKVLPNPDAQTVSAYQNAFSLRIFRQLLKHKKLRNHLISPYFVETTLGIMYDGADGRTKAEIGKTLQKKSHSEVTEMHKANAEIIAEFGNLDKRFQLYYANGLWARSDFQLNEKYATHVNELYQTKLESVDFSAPITRDHINNWVTEQTAGKMPPVLKKVEPEDQLALINALYLKGFWKKNFRGMGVLNFHLPNGEDKEHQFMYRSDKFEYFEDDYCQAVRLPYYKTDMFMELYIPKEDMGITDIDEKLNPGTWQTWVNSFETKLGTVVLPKFQFSSRIHLPKMLYSIGLESPFTTGADFSNMIDGKGKVSKMISASILIVDEEGVEAPMLEAPEGKSFRMVADHPFFFVIRKRSSNKILFIGTVIAPKW